MMRRRGFVILSGLEVLGGCSASLLPKPPAPAARYTLDDGLALPDRAVPTPPPGARVLLVAQPTSGAGYDGTALVYMRQAQQLERFAFHEWVEPVPRMLAPLLLRALQRTGEFRAVLLAPTSAVADLRLETELVRLQHDFTVRPSQVRLTLSAVLVDAHTRQVIAAQSFDEAATGGDDPVTGVAAAQHVAVRALAALAAACGRWARAREGR